MKDLLLRVKNSNIKGLLTKDEILENQDLRKICKMAIVNLSSSPSYTGCYIDDKGITIDLEDSIFESVFIKF